ncbi:MAG: GNAT family N-acetyltransferase [Phycisphaeraceae bacterium]|nr:GNAT family N-acetyltransferase [Phycisphaeraceae bacterium]
MNTSIGSYPATVPSEPVFKPRHVVLKDGREVLIRQATPDDASAMVGHMHAALPEIRPYVLTLLEEWKFDEAKERQFLAGLDPRRGQLMILAEHDGQIVAVANTSVVDRRRRSHVATLGIHCRQAFWGSGLGTAMMAALVDWVERHPMLMKLTLAVYVDNERAIRLYRRFGFIEEARLRGETQREPGEFVDDLLMALWVKPQPDSRP